MDKFAKKKTKKTKKRMFAKNTWHDWCDWLFNCILRQLKLVRVFSFRTNNHTRNENNGVRNKNLSIKGLFDKLNHT